MLAYELFLKNQKNIDESIKRIVPIKKMFVKVDSAVTFS